MNGVALLRSVGGARQLARGGARQIQLAGAVECCPEIPTHAFHRLAVSAWPYAFHSSVQRSSGCAINVSAAGWLSLSGGPSPGAKYPPPAPGSGVSNFLWAVLNPGCNAAAYLAGTCAVLGNPGSVLGADGAARVLAGGGRTRLTLTWPVIGIVSPNYYCPNHVLAPAAWNSACCWTFDVGEPPPATGTYDWLGDLGWQWPMCHLVACACIDHPPSMDCPPSGEQAFDWGTLTATVEYDGVFGPNDVFPEGAQTAAWITLEVTPIAISGVFGGVPVNDGTLAWGGFSLACVRDVPPWGIPGHWSAIVPWSGSVSGYVTRPNPPPADHDCHNYVDDADAFNYSGNGTELIASCVVS